MGKGGGGGGDTEQRVEQTNLPEYYRPYAERLAERAEALSLAPYEAYQGPRLEYFTPDQLAAFDGVRAQQGAYLPYLQAAAGAYGNTQNFTNSMMGFGSSVPGAENYVLPAPNMISAGQADFTGWDNGVRDHYMSPYQQGVTDIALRQAKDDFLRAMSMNGLRAAKVGAFGGSRQGVTEGMLAGDWLNRAADIRTKGLQSAYENAQQQFERDRQSRFGVQSLNITKGLEADRANQTALLDSYARSASNMLDAERLRQAGYGLGMEAAKAQGALGAEYAKLGETDQRLGLQGLEALLKTGGQQQQLGQTALDTAYANFLAQRNYPQEQIGFFSNILRGIPTTTDRYVTTQSANPSALQTIAGLGLTGAGLGLFGGGKKAGGPVRAYAHGGGVKRYQFGGGVSPGEQSITQWVNTLGPEAIERLLRMGDQTVPTHVLRQRLDALNNAKTTQGALASSLTGGTTPNFTSEPAGFAPPPRDPTGGASLNFMGVVDNRRPPTDVLKTYAGGDLTPGDKTPLGRTLGAALRAPGAALEAVGDAAMESVDYKNNLLHAASPLVTGLFKEQSRAERDKEINAAMRNTWDAAKGYNVRPNRPEAPQPRFDTDPSPYPGRPDPRGTDPYDREPSGLAALLPEGDREFFGSPTSGKKYETSGPVASAPKRGSTQVASVPTGGGTGGPGGMGGGRSGSSSAYSGETGGALERLLADATQKKPKTAADIDLPLATAGLALLSGKGGFVRSLGNAGLAALTQKKELDREEKSDEKDRIKLAAELGLGIETRDIARERNDIARYEAMAAAQARGDQAATNALYRQAMIDKINQDLEDKRYESGRAHELGVTPAQLRNKDKAVDLAILRKGFGENDPKYMQDAESIFLQDFTKRWQTAINKAVEGGTFDQFAPVLEQQRRLEFAQFVSPYAPVFGNPAEDAAKLKALPPNAVFRFKDGTVWRMGYGGQAMQLK